MTQNRELKRRIRMRMRATGEGYMQARAAVISDTTPSRLTPRDDRSTPNMSTSDSVVPPPPPAWTPRAQVLLRGAESHAIRWRHGWVGTEHLLLAIIEERDGIAGQLLEKAGVSEQLKREIHELFGSEGYYTSGVMDLDDEGNPIIDPETGEAKHHDVPPQPD